MNAWSHVYFGLHRLLGSQVKQFYEELVRLEQSPSSVLERIKNDRLEKLLQHARTNVPFYRDRAPATTSARLQDYPILTKLDLREKFLDLMTPRLREEYDTGRRKQFYSWVKVQTGGSTGIPATVVHDAHYRDRGRAARLFSQRLCGFPLGVPFFRLWGNMRDINEMSDSIYQRTQRMFQREVLLNAFQMDDKRIASYIKTINRSHVEHLIGYVDSIEQLARHALSHGIRLRHLKSIMACAGTLTEDVRQLLVEAFGGKVHNFYGSRECAAIACECDQGGLHVFSSHLIVETVDEGGRQLTPGERGRILITLLQNLEFPIIRYEIGDVGAVSNAECRCGRPFPILKRLEGRTLEFLRSTTGGFVSPVYVRHLIGVVHNPGLIRRFQLEQTSLIEFTLRYQLEPGVSTERERETFALIARDLKAVLGRDCHLSFSCVQDFETAPSGKFLYTINRLSGMSQ